MSAAMNPIPIHPAHARELDRVIRCSVQLATVEGRVNAPIRISRREAKRRIRAAAYRLGLPIPKIAWSRIGGPAGGWAEQFARADYPEMINRVADVVESWTPRAPEPREVAECDS